VPGTGLQTTGRKLAFIVVTAGVVAAAGLVTGLTVVEAPLLAWALVGLVAAAVLMFAPAHVRIAVTVLTAVGSRLLVATGYVSSFANFVHYPLALSVALIAAVESPRRFPIRRPLEVGLIGLLLVSLASWLVNGGEVIRPFLDWLVFAEPLLVVYAVVTMRPGRARTALLWGMAVGIPLTQLPLAVYQALALGFSDPVQGFFIGMGSGAHVAGAVSLVGSLVCVARGLAPEKVRSAVAWMATGILLFFVAIIADAKQVVIAFLPALLILVVGSMRLRASWLLIALPVLVGLWLLLSTFPPLQKLFDWPLISRGALGKLDAFSLIVSRLSSGWVRWLVGLGPGNSVSRVAMMGLDAFVKHDSPVFLLGLGPAATTIELWNLTASNRLFASSSVWSFVSSWLGLLGDLGLAGFAMFVWMLAVVWAGLRRRPGWEASAARAVFVMMVLLAFLYSWLEEPGFTMTAALVIGLGCLAGEREPGVGRLGRSAGGP
jgi:hypothetical protein